MKIKLLAATVLFLALGISTTEAQNRQRAKDQNSFEKKGHKDGGISRSDKKDGKFRKGDKKFKSGKMMKNRHRKEFRKDKKRSGFHKRNHRSHRF